MQESLVRYDIPCIYESLPPLLPPSLSLPPSLTVLAASAIELVNDKQTRNSNGDIILSWETPDPVEARGKIIEYRIEFREAGTNEEGDTQRKRQNECPRGHCILREDETSSCCTVGPDKTTANITGLDPSKDYEVSVIVYNSAGAGETQTITIMGKSINNISLSFPHPPSLSLLSFPLSPLLLLSQSQVHHLIQRMDFQ